MMDAFYSETECNTITITSAFREYIRQQEILDEYTAILGRTEAKKRVALPGHSEHNAGLAVDFGVYNDGELGTFLHTGINGWFFLNSYKYGFIPRYPENKTAITKTAYEPWHFRYVGVPHAYFIRQSGMCLEEYIEFIMGFTYDNPYKALFDGEEYEVYFTRDSEIPIPYDKGADISGNNIDGFIVTIKL
jgi:D-alanyl-D-alanine carboxypeptidase